MKEDDRDFLKRFLQFSFSMGTLIVLLLVTFSVSDMGIKDRKEKRKTEKLKREYLLKKEMTDVEKRLWRKIKSIEKVTENREQAILFLILVELKKIEEKEMGVRSVK